MKRLLTERNFIHATAGCIFEMSPYHYEEIGDIINAVSDFVKNKSDTKMNDFFAFHCENRYEFYKEFKDMLFKIPQFRILNVSRNLRKQGVTDPSDERNSGMVFSGRGIAPEPRDSDFIDLDACARNIVNEVWDLSEEKDCFLCKNANGTNCGFKENCKTCTLNPNLKNNYESRNG